MSEIRVAIGRDNICNRLGINKHFFYELVHMGMPFGKVRNTWMIDLDAAEEFMKGYCGEKEKRETLSSLPLNGG